MIYKLKKLDENEVGKKAYNLNVLRNENYKVPDFIVLTEETLEKIEKKIKMQ